MSEADDPDDRQTLLVREVMRARREGETVTFRARDATVEYADRLLRVEVDDDERDALDALLDEFPVFKVKQPETRKADESVVYVSAIADPKHAADFVEAAFRRAFGLPGDYRLSAVRN